MLNVDGSISTKTGVAPMLLIASAVAKNVNGVVITSSPGSIPEALQAVMRASVPGVDADRVLDPEIRRNLLLQFDHVRPQDEPPRAEHPLQGVDELVPVLVDLRL